MARRIGTQFKTFPQESAHVETSKHIFISGRHRLGRPSRNRFTQRGKRGLFLFVTIYNCELDYSIEIFAEWRHFFFILLVNYVSMVSETGERAGEIKRVGAFQRLICACMEWFKQSKYGKGGVFCVVPSARITETSRIIPTTVP